MTTKIYRYVPTGEPDPAHKRELLGMVRFDAPGRRVFTWHADPVAVLALPKVGVGYEIVPHRISTLAEFRLWLGNATLHHDYSMVGKLE